MFYVMQATGALRVPSLCFINVYHQHMIRQNCTLFLISKNSPSFTAPEQKFKISEKENSDWYTKKILCHQGSFPVPLVANATQHMSLTKMHFHTNVEY